MLSCKVFSASCLLAAVSGLRRSRTEGASAGACADNPSSCACFVERAPNFCDSCPACGGCEAFCSGATPAPADCSAFGALLEETDIAGDYVAQKDFVHSEDQCCNFCDEFAAAGCEGYAYSAANHACYLKGNFRGTFPQGGVVTRLRTSLGAGCPGFGAAQQGMDLAGELIDDWAAPSEEACCSSCSKKPGCQGFSFFEGRCYLKSNVQGTFDKAGCITRVKEGALPGPTPAPTTAQCCNRGGCSEYDPAVEQCCGGTGSQSATVCSAAQGCCPGEGVNVGGIKCFDPATQQCCGNSPSFFVCDKTTIAPTPAPTTPPTPASAQCGEFGTMLWETDMSGTYLRQVDGVASSEECCPFCEESAACDGYSYNAANRACYLKSGFIGTFPNGGAVTRLKTSLGAGCSGFAAAQQGKDLAGQLLENWAAPSEEACCASCSKKPGCQGFAFFDGRCYLKANVQGTFDKAGCITRVKV